MKNEILPTLSHGQSFNCCNGCGVCAAIEYDFVYSETRDAVTDEVIESKSHKAFKSSCCGDDVEIWDEFAEEVVPWPTSK